MGKRNVKSSQQASQSRPAGSGAAPDAGGLPGLSIKIQGGTAPPATQRPGGMRSPLVDAATPEAAQSGAVVGGAAANAPSPASGQAGKGGRGKAGERAPAGEAARQLREISQIQGMDQSHDLPLTQATQLSLVMFDQGPRRKRRVLGVIVVLALVGAGGFFVFNQKQRGLWIERLGQLKDETIGRVRPSRKKKPEPRPRGVYVGRPTGTAVPVDDAEVIAGLPKGGCAKTIAALGASERLLVPERVALAECYLLVDNPASADNALRPLRDRIARLPEADLNKMKTQLTLVDALHDSVTALLREGKPREADTLVGGRCRQWEQTNSCVAKMIAVADRHLPAGAGILKMFESRGRLEPKAQARLWLAGAQMALVDGRPATADQRYSMALAAAPRGALALRKQIYETEAVDLYHRGELVKLKSVISFAISDLREVDFPSKTKLRLLGELTSAPNKSKAVKRFLTLEEVTFRAAGDFDLIDILGPESLRYGLETDFLRLLHRTREQFASRYRSTNSSLRRIAVWEIRAALSQKAWDQALTQLSGYEHAYGDDVFLHHMRGVAYMSSSTNHKYQILAAQEFQAAIRKKSNWESLYSLGLALVRSDKGDQVAPVVRDLERIIATKGQRYWVDMLKAEFYLATDQTANAQRLLNQWADAEPDYVTPRLLLVQLYKKAGKGADAMRQENRLDEIARVQRYSGSREGLASPIGVMALGERPTE